MAKTRVKISGLGRDFIRTQLTTIRRLSERQIEAIARETEIVIQQEINKRTQRADATGNLADAFFAVPITDGWGVGDINYLNQNAKYWYWQNFGIAQSGRTTPPQSIGQFSPGVPQPTAGHDGGRWYQSSTGGFLITPTKPITAKNYIQATINKVNSIVTSVVGRIKL